MQEVVFVIPSLDYGGAARQLMLLAGRLPRDRFRPCVCVLGGPSAWGDELATAGITVETLGRTRSFDLLPFLALRRRLKSSAGAVVHAWGTAALRAVALTWGTRGVWASAALPPLGKPGCLDTWLLRRVARVVAFGEAEAERYRGIGVARERVVVVPPAVVMGEPGASANGERTPVADATGSPTRFPGRVVVAIGPHRGHKGVRNAVWTTDLLHYLYADFDLVLVGEPPSDREMAGLSHVPRVHLVGRCRDLTPYLERADLVWVPGRAGGVNGALEAMATGKAIIAARTPQMAELIEDGVTGLLFNPGDKSDLARQTRRLLDDDARRRELGEAARRRVAECFAPDNLVARYAALLEQSRLQ